MEEAKVDRQKETNKGRQRDRTEGKKKQKKNKERKTCRFVNCLHNVSFHEVSVCR